MPDFSGRGYIMATRVRNVQKIFSEVPKTYEFVNHILTFGLDILWRRKAARVAASLATGPDARLLDICTGTGETASHLQRWAPAETEVVAADFTIQMLKAGMT
ncbi:MAG: class I SAM-dependent methyltransferase, partial [Dehalococcoidia bacterium]|nr:class I SAM-dependent methyltransferase [Dehalococcoidia bacterium]